MSKSAAGLALACAVVGVGASLAAAYVHYHLLLDPTYTSFCDVNATVSCTQVYLSRFSTVRGIPVALIGAIWFVGATLLALSGLVGSETARENAPGYLFAVSTVALAVVLYFEYVSFVVLKAVCALCLTMAAAVVALFFLSGSTTPFPMTTLPRRAARDLRALFTSPVALVVTLLFLGGAATTLAWFPREAASAAGASVEEAAKAGQSPAAAPAPTQSQASEFEKYWEAREHVAMAIPAEGAKVLIVKFNDFQCPPCRNSHLAYKPLLTKFAAEHPGQVRYVLKDYPLDAECNVNVANTIHPAACEAAVAVRLARTHNREDQMIEWIFANQPQLTPELVKQGAREVGQVTDFDAKYAATLESVKSEIALGKQLGVMATPTFFINGKKVDGALPPQYFQQAIEYELKNAK
ncbi:MAG: vitamin K epoxide reductase family protein [Acidobacteriota bacterium]